MLIPLLSSAACIISSLEWLSLRGEFKNEGFYSWPVRQTSNFLFNKKLLYHVFDFLYKYPNVLFILVVQLIAASFIPIIYYNLTIASVLCFLIALCSILIALRGRTGYCGADLMTKITFLAIGLALLSSNLQVWRACLVFLSGQVLVAYGTPGILRISNKKWLNGSQLLNIIRLNTYGHRSIWQHAVNYPVLVKASAIGVVLFEFGSLFALFLPLPFLLLYLACGLIFHLLNSIIMGLNTFFLSFIAIYPALIWLSIIINRILYSGQVQLY